MEKGLVGQEATGEQGGDGGSVYLVCYVLAALCARSRAVSGGKAPPSLAAGSAGTSKDAFAGRNPSPAAVIGAVLCPPLLC